MDNNTATDDVTRDTKFDAWWTQFAAPQVEANFFSRQFESKIRDGAKVCWDEAWKECLNG